MKTIDTASEDDCSYWTNIVETYPSLRTDADPKENKRTLLSRRISNIRTEIEFNPLFSDMMMVQPRSNPQRPQYEVCMHTSNKDRHPYLVMWARVVLMLVIQRDTDFVAAYLGISSSV